MPHLKNKVEFRHRIQRLVQTDVEYKITIFCLEVEWAIHAWIQAIYKGV